MARVTIISPADQAAAPIPTTPKGVFIAWGRCHMTVSRVTGQCVPDGGGAAVRSLHSHCSLDPVSGEFQRWVLLFRLHGLPYLPTAVGYTLQATGLTANGPLPPVTSHFRVGAAKGTFGAVTITWPTANEDISAYADNFAPYGTLSPDPLATVVLTDTDNPSLSPALIYSFDDPTDLQFWYAQFPTLTDLHYDLDVADVNNGSDQAHGLFIA